MSEEKGFLRSPLIASLADTTSNIYKGLNIGFSGNISKPSGWNFSKGEWSVGGMLSSAGLAPVGAVAGAYLGMQLNPENEESGAITGAIGGAVAGAAALPMLGLTAKGIGVGAEALGSAIIGMGKGATDSVGTSGFGTLFTGASTLLAHSPTARFVSGMSKSLVNYDEAAESLSKVNLTGLGKGLLTASALYKGAKGALNEEMNIRLGQRDNYITTPTPRTPSYTNNAGASGDLVFALNKLRNG